MKLTFIFLAIAIAAAGCVSQATIFGGATVIPIDRVTTVAYSKVVDQSAGSLLCTDPTDSAETLLYVNNVPSYASFDSANSFVRYTSSSGQVYNAVPDTRSIPNGLSSSLNNAQAFGFNGRISNEGARCGVSYHIVFTEQQTVVTNPVTTPPPAAQPPTGNAVATNYPSNPIGDFINSILNVLRSIFR